MSSRQQRMFPGITVDQTRIRVKGGVEAGYDDDELALGDVIQMIVTGHVTFAGVELDEKLEQTVRHYVMTADTVKVLSEQEREEPDA